VIAVGGRLSRPAARGRDSRGVGFYGFFARPKKLKNSGGSVFIGVFLLLFIHTLARLFAFAAPPHASASAPGAWRMHPYSLYIVLRSLHHNAIVNAAAGVANPARVSYSDNVIAVLGVANARGVSNPYPARVRIANCARVADAIARRGC